MTGTRRLGGRPPDSCPRIGAKLVLGQCERSLDEFLQVVVLPVFDRSMFFTLKFGLHVADNVKEVNDEPSSMDIGDLHAVNAEHKDALTIDVSQDISGEEHSVPTCWRAERPWKVYGGGGIDKDNVVVLEENIFINQTRSSPTLRFLKKHNVDVEVSASMFFSLQNEVNFDGVTDEPEVNMGSMDKVPIVGTRMVKIYLRVEKHAGGKNASEGKVVKQHNYVGRSLKLGNMRGLQLRKLAEVRLAPSSTMSD
ncbi:hypothetical protein V6N11_018981 [Hibiscus sabdariffa]|uniref:Uncharacterized protein n=1 Tax=Hibiscus sabdariffa TaxID=183260 RepID=A0ABR2R142_9ROSI